MKRHSLKPIYALLLCALLGILGIVPAGSALAAAPSVVMPPACSYHLIPQGATFGRNGGPDDVTVTATPGCYWTAVSNNPNWIHITDGYNGYGDGTVYYTVEPNCRLTARTGTMTIAGKTFTVNQNAGFFSVSPGSFQFTEEGGSDSIAVNTLLTCPWTATTSAPWITITSGDSGSGDGNVTFDVAPNISSNARTGTISVGSRTVSVYQSGIECSKICAAHGSKPQIAYP